MVHGDLYPDLCDAGRCRSVLVLGYEDDEIPNVGEIHPVPKKLERIVMRSIDRNPRKRTRQLKKLEAMLMI